MRTRSTEIGATFFQFRCCLLKVTVVVNASVLAHVQGVDLGDVLGAHVPVEQTDAGLDALRVETLREGYDATLYDVLEQDLQRKQRRQATGARDFATQTGTGIELAHLVRQFVVLLGQLEDKRVVDKARNFNDPATKTIER